MLMSLILRKDAIISFDGCALHFGGGVVLPLQNTAEKPGVKATAT